MTNLAENLVQALNKELRNGEKLVWAEQPIPSQLVKSAYLLWLFFVPWTLFALFWTAGASGFQWPALDNIGVYSLFPLFGLPFILIGVYGLVMPFKMRKKAESTVYAITNQRLLIGHFPNAIELQIFFPKDVNRLTRFEKSDGSGNLIFSNQAYLDSDGGKNISKEGFYAVRDVKKVELLVEAFLKTNQVI